MSMKKVFVMMAVLLASVTASANDNFKLTGKIDGASNDTLCIEYTILQPQKQHMVHKVAVKAGEFLFHANLKEAYSAKMYLKTNPKESLYFYLVPDEEAVFSGSLNSVDEHWSGSTFYQQYERITELQRPFNIEFVAARNDPDSIRGEKNRDINRRAHSVLSLIHI